MAVWLHGSVESESRFGRVSSSASLESIKTGKMWKHPLPPHNKAATPTSFFSFFVAGQKNEGQVFSVYTLSRLSRFQYFYKFLRNQKKTEKKNFSRTARKSHQNSNLLCSQLFCSTGPCWPHPLPKFFCATRLPLAQLLCRISEAHASSGQIEGMARRARASVGMSNAVPNGGGAGKGAPSGGQHDFSDEGCAKEKLSTKCLLKWWW